MIKTVLFACVHNAGRSQLAAAWFNHLADPAKARAISAGTQPAAHVHPGVVRLLAEEGLAESLEAPRLLTPQLAATATMLITLGCGETCPVVPGLQREDWLISDPKGRPATVIEAIGREVEVHVLDLLDRKGWRARR